MRRVLTFTWATCTATTVSTTATTTTAATTTTTTTTTTPLFFLYITFISSTVKLSSKVLAWCAIIMRGKRMKRKQHTWHDAETAKIHKQKQRNDNADVTKKNVVTYNCQLISHKYCTCLRCIHIQLAASAGSCEKDGHSSGNVFFCCSEKVMVYEMHVWK